MEWNAYFDWYLEASLETIRAKNTASTLSLTLSLPLLLPYIIFYLNYLTRRFFFFLFQLFLLMLLPFSQQRRKKKNQKVIIAPLRRYLLHEEVSCLFCLYIHPGPEQNLKPSLKNFPIQVRIYWNSLRNSG